MTILQLTATSFEEPRKAGGKKAEVLIYIGDEQARPSLRKIRGMRKVDVQKVLSIALRRHEELLIAWRQLYGG